jgi:hypothetical protein
MFLYVCCVFLDWSRLIVYTPVVLHCVRGILNELCALFIVLHADPNQMMAMQGMGDEEAMMNLAIALSLNEVGQYL